MFLFPLFYGLQDIRDGGIAFIAEILHGDAGGIQLEILFIQSRRHFLHHVFSAGQLHAFFQEIQAPDIRLGIPVISAPRTEIHLILFQIVFRCLPVKIFQHGSGIFFGKQLSILRQKVDDQHSFCPPVFLLVVPYCDIAGEHHMPCRGQRQVPRQAVSL